MMRNPYGITYSQGRLHPDSDEKYHSSMEVKHNGEIVGTLSQRRADGGWDLIRKGQNYVAYGYVNFKSAHWGMTGMNDCDLAELRLPPERWPEYPLVPNQRELIMC